jgi:hypothetical protein
MKIKSRFKDYYDYVAHAYGGGDERVTYVREPLKDEQLEILSDDRFDIVGPGLSEFKTREKYLVVNGLVYVLISTITKEGLIGPYKLFTEQNFGEELGQLRTRYRYGYDRYNKEGTPEYWARFFAKESDTALVVSKLIQQPVFLINYVGYDYTIKKYRISIDKNIPVLSEYGIPHHVQPEQLYQDIAYYVSNKMVSSPDLEVHDNMTDKEKIVQHGFDLKQSFRHRT